MLLPIDIELGQKTVKVLCQTGDIRPEKRLRNLAPVVLTFVNLIVFASTMLLVLI